MKKYKMFAISKIFLFLLIYLFIGCDNANAQCNNDTEKPYNRYTLAYNASRAAYLKADIDMWNYLNTTKDPLELRLKNILEYHLVYLIEDFDNYFQAGKYDQINFKNWTRLERDLLEVEGITRLFQMALKVDINDTSYNYTKIFELCNTYVLPNDTSFYLPYIFNSSEYILNVAKIGAKLLEESKRYEKKLKWLNIPEQVHLRRFYADLEISEFKGYVLVQFCEVLSTLLNKTDNANFKIRASKAMNLHKRYVDHIATYTKVFRETQKEVHRSLYMPDPSHYELGVNYERLTRFREVVLIEEDALEGMNRRTCDDYNEKTYYNRLHCEEIHECEHFDWQMHACPSSTPDQLFTYIRGDNSGDRYGPYEGCDRDEYFYDWKSDWFVRQDNCVCGCTTKDWVGDRYFSTVATFSDFHYDKVIVGVRFVKKNRIIHLQIKEGKLMRYGEIDPSSLAWKPIDNFGTGSSSKYMALTFYYDGVYLDHIERNDDYVVTGVQMIKRDGGVRLAVHFSKYDFIWGKLIAPRENSFWDYHTSYSDYKTPPRYPVYGSAKTSLYRRDNTKLKFTHTYWRVDGQKTIPYIDIQTVAPDPPMPLSGLEFAYKKGSDHAGFLAPIVIRYDMSMQPIM